MIEIHAIIKGHVQGVGFRFTAREYATRFGIVGTVCNLPDGNVEIFVLGKNETIQEFLNALSGPKGPGQVKSISQEEVIPSRQYSDFKIVF